MLRLLVVGGLLAALVVLPANATAAGLWTERVIGDAPPGLPFGESVSLTPDGLGIFAVATSSPSSPVTLMASTVVAGVPGPLAAVEPPAMGRGTLLAAGAGRAALVVTQSQAGAQRVTLASGPVGGPLGPARVLIDGRGLATFGSVVTSARGDVAIPYVTGSALRVVVARPDGRVRRFTLVQGDFTTLAGAFNAAGDLVIVAARARARVFDFVARRLAAGGRLGALQDLDRIRAVGVSSEPAVDVAVAGPRAVAAWRVAECGEEGCGPATAHAAVLGARHPSTLSRGLGRLGPDGATPRVTVSPTGRATVGWTDRAGQLRAAELRTTGRGPSMVISDAGPPAQPLAIQRAPTGETVVLSLRGACPCPSYWTLQATLRSPSRAFGAPEQVAAERLPNPYAWLVIDPSRRLALAAYDFARQRLTVAARPY